VLEATAGPAAAARATAAPVQSNQRRLAALGGSSALTVARAGDPAERAANRFADAVTPARSRPGGAAAGGPGRASLPPHSVGAPLAAGLRASFERALGTSLGGVRLHTDSAAAASASHLHARAYTAGQDIYFQSGKFAPESPRGRWLLAHELAHVAQQGAGAPQAIQRVGETEEEPEVAGAEEEEAGETTLEPDQEVMDGDAPLGPHAPDEEPQEAAANDVELPDETGDATELDGTGAEPMGKGGKGGKGGGKGAKPKAPPPKITTIKVDLASQSLTVKSDDGTLDRTFPVSTGRGCPNTADDPCPTGKEQYCTEKVTDAAPGRIEGKGYVSGKGDAMAYYVGVVDDRGIGIHDSWKADGTPRSHGCIRTGEGAVGLARAELVNKHVTKDTKITVSGKAPTKKWTLDKKHTLSSYPGCPLPPEPKKKPGKAKKAP
jgi:hypothetical protein